LGVTISYGVADGRCSNALRPYRNKLPLTTDCFALLATLVFKTNKPNLLHTKVAKSAKKEHHQYLWRSTPAFMLNVG